jgi:hypothetical protein
MPRQIVLIHGNVEEKVGDKRFELQRSLLPNGDEDGEVVDVKSAGNQPLTLDAMADTIVQELGTVSLIPDARRVVVVHDLADFRSGRGGGAAGGGKKKKAAAGRGWALLQDFLLNSLPQTPNWLLFVFNEDDEKMRWVDKKGALYEFCQRHGDIFELSEQRIDWRFQNVVLEGDLSDSIRLLREWGDRPGSTQFRVVQTMHQLLQLLLQARLREEAKAAGRDPSVADHPDKRLSFSQQHPYKQRLIAARARTIPLARLRRALELLDEAQRAFFPTGEELHIPNAWDILEQVLVEILAEPVA